MIFVTTGFGEEYIYRNLPSYLSSIWSTHYDSCSVKILIDSESLNSKQIRKLIDDARHLGLNLEVYETTRNNVLSNTFSSRSAIASTKVELWYKALEYLNQDAKIQFAFQTWM